MPIVDNKPQRFTIPRGLDRMRLDHVIAQVLGLPRKAAKGLVESGCVLYNGARATFGSRKVKSGAEVLIRGENRTEGPDAGIRVPILLEDDDILVVNKPPRLVTCRGGFERGRSVAEMLEHMGRKVYPVHRLDRETSGALVFAKTEQAKTDLEGQFRRRSVRKVYIGVVEGDMKRSGGTLRGELVKTGEYGQTRYRVAEKLKRASIVEFMPLTGRTNQIRLQLLAIGCCLVGEKKYIPKRLRSSIVFPRAALHAWRIGFKHPRTGKPVICEAPMPQDMLSLMERLGRERSP